MPIFPSHMSVDTDVDPFAVEDGPISVRVTDQAPPLISAPVS
jgi:hypothetical protein